MPLLDLTILTLAIPAGGIAVGAFVLGWLVRDVIATAPRTGGTLDLSPAAARGELSFDWEDPRDVDATTSRHVASSGGVGVTPDGVCEAVIPPDVLQEARVVEPVAVLDRDALKTRLAEIGATPERPRLGLASNVVAIDQHRGSRRA